MAWLSVFWKGTLGVLLVKLTAPIAVWFIDSRKTHPVYGNSQTTDFGWWNSAIRNSGHNYSRRPQVPYREYANTTDETLERMDGFQWRKRVSLDGKYVSFRCTWGKPRKSKGKKEFYIGWTMRPLGFEDDTMSLTFFQFRPF